MSAEGAKTLCETLKQITALKKLDIWGLNDLFFHNQILWASAEVPPVNDLLIEHGNKNDKREMK